MPASCCNPWSPLSPQYGRVAGSGVVDPVDCGGQGLRLSRASAVVSARGIVPRIARRGVDSSERLGRYRWKIERNLTWLTGYRRPTIRYERHGEHFAAFLQLAAALTCFKNLAK